MDFTGISHYDPTGTNADEILLYDGDGSHYGGADFVPVSEHFVENFTESEFQETHTVLADGGDRFGVSAVAFDLQEELLWMGNQGGHLTSYYGLGMQKYTSFQVHTTQEVRQIHPFETGVLALSQTSLRCQMRRGIPIFTYSSQTMEDMQCMLQISPTSLLMGGHQDKLIEFDLAKVTETNVRSVGENGCAILRQQVSGGRYICCGDPAGRVHLRDPYTLRVEQTLDAHTGSLSDLDIHANMLVTCGFSSRHGVMAVDRFMNAFDLRMMRAMTPITLALDPLLLRFLPLFSSRVAIVSNLGQVQLVDTAALTQPGDMCVFQVNTGGAMCLTFDVSSSCQCLAFGDGGGSVHLFNSGGAHASFNSFSQETEFADPVESIPPISILDENMPLSTVPFPLCSTGALLSDWPERFCKPTFRRTPVIDPQILQTMKMVGTVGYAPNPGNRKRNQVPYKLEKRGRTHKSFSNDTRPGKIGEDGSSVLTIPRRYRRIEVKYSKMGADDFDFDLYNRTGFCGLEATLPNSYCNAMLQILHYLDPVRSVLLSHLCQKEFCLSCELGFLFHMLDISHGFPCQASNFLRAFRTIPEASALGLILSDQGESKKKTDLIRLIQSWNRFILHQMHFEILEERKRKQYETQQMYLRSESPVLHDQFVYKEKDFPSISGDQQHKPDKLNPDEDKENGSDERKKSKDKPEIGEENPNEETDISRLFGTRLKNINKCLKCGKEVIKESSLLLCNLIYPDLSTGKNNKEYNFSDILHQSLCPEQTTPAWCDHCSRYQPTHQSRRIQALPNVLVNNCGMESQKDKTFWQTQMDLLVQKAQQNNCNNEEQVNPNVKQCRYGANCTRAGCRFRHSGRTETKATSSSHLYYTNSWLPLHIQIDLMEGGCLKIRKIDAPQNVNSKTKPEVQKIDEETEASNDKSDGENTNKGNEAKRGRIIQTVVYDLCSVVCHIQDQASTKDKKNHLVALVKAGPGYHIRSVGSPVSQWYIFNDFSIMPIVAPEVVWFNLEWKIPCVLYWMRSDLPSDFVSPIHNPISLDVFGEDKCLARNGGRKMITFTPLAADEMPSEGEIVAMDAEFVTLNQEEAELRSDGKMSTIKPSHMSVARITCIRGQGPLEGTPFIDDYISTQEQVVDYKTKFSGIKPGDLDANFSSKHLTTLKSTYQKLRFLVDNGVKFVGHGLKNDFRVINLVVPAEQVIDTVLLFHMPHHRMVSLRFLAWHFLGVKIQSVTHDSIEDARAALQLYQEHSRLQEEGKVTAALKVLYEVGKKLQWRVPGCND
ncbi:PAN2-PAN3 deadenylation complex catalytic subunit PAN2 [Hetaerina americana]|uniref:PAN2-PAN3 deadenylation complex catalytic subunit PAN2 n=1 Tax=Hetaerina americana TaxID=62018 RepID=UPI003A7F469F